MTDAALEAIRERDKTGGDRGDQGQTMEDRRALLIEVDRLRAEVKKFEFLYSDETSRKGLLIIADEMLRLRAGIRLATEWLRLRAGIRLATEWLLADNAFRSGAPLYKDECPIGPRDRFRAWVEENK